jgi:acetylornithine/N-succinyldiaminopimelate aminotransferase
LVGDGFLASVRETGDRFRARLQRLSESLGLGEVRGEGLLLALDLGRDVANDVVARARESGPCGLLLNAPRPNLLRFMPALNTVRGEIDEGLGMLARVLREPRK